MSLIEHSENSYAPVSRKPKRIPAKVRQAIELLSTGECTTQKAAAIRAGITPEWFSRCLSRPDVEAFIAQRTRRSIAAGQMRASARVLELIDASSEHVSLDASKHVLGIAGISPPERAGVVINNNVAPGYVINLGDPSAASHALPNVEAGGVIEAQAIEITEQSASGPSDAHTAGAEES